MFKAISHQLNLTCIFEIIFFTRLRFGLHIGEQSLEVRFESHEVGPRLRVASPAVKHQVVQLHWAPLGEGLAFRMLPVALRIRLPVAPANLFEDGSVVQRVRIWRCPACPDMAYGRM